MSLAESKSPVILDTPILMALVRKGNLGAYIQAAYTEIVTSTDPPLLSYVSMAEALVLAARNGWGQQRIDRLYEWLGYFQIVPIDSPGVIEAYVAIDVYSSQIGRSMGKNDLWIAATSAALGIPLLTSDRDFDHLDPGYLTRIWIDPASALSL